MSAALLRCRGVVLRPSVCHLAEGLSSLVACLRPGAIARRRVAVPVLVLAALDLLGDPVFIFEVVVVGLEIVFGPVVLILCADLIGERPAHHSSAFKSSRDAT